MKVLEQFTAGKKGDSAQCEDVIFVSDDFACVSDGSSIGPAINGKPSGRLISDAIVEGLSQVPADADMPTATRIINAHIRNVFGYESSEAIMALGKRPSASVIIFSNIRRELWAYGDTLAMFDGYKPDLTKQIDHVATAVRCTAVRALLAQGKTVEELIANGEDFEAVKPLLDLQQPSFLNRNDVPVYGYANLDGGDQVIELVNVISICDAKSLVLASDGYIDIHPTLAECEAELADVLQHDPLMYDIAPQVKGMRTGLESFDDRAYLSLELD